ncbi:hypothetical protein CK203_005069 [Vitis vinifera]|uniref:Uncharacterized protein n=1 Tax=Vitis vinifera TaxID=29760 RepID=A0A438KEV0_VITVI|nr:hypothetical protein CK203_005069 [Vitis vinifera]
MAKCRILQKLPMLYINPWGGSFESFTKLVRHLDKPRRLILLSQPCSQYLAYSAKTLATQKLKKLGRQLLKEWKLFITQRSFYKCLEAPLLGALAK